MKKLKEIKNGNYYYNGYCLKDLAIKYGTPLKVTFLDVIDEHIKSLKNEFDNAINELNYQGKFIYLNANKANYGGAEVKQAYLSSDGLESSSYYDLMFIHQIYKDNNDHKKPIYCNGYKQHDYLDEIIQIKKEGFDITDIIDSYDEYEYLKSQNVELNVGLRVHLPAQYLEEGDCVLNDRFGLIDEDFNKIIEDIKNTKLTLTTIHFHQRGMDYEEDKFKINFEKAFNNYYVKAAKLYDSVVNFDMGGGTPLPVLEGFDYTSWAKEVIELLKKSSIKANVKEPNLLSENGKYSQKDATINIYKVVAKKNTDPYIWHIVDGSLLIALPEMYALGEPILTTPLNGLDKKTIKGRLAGITCDCDDVLYDKKKGYFDLPDVRDLYIGCLGTGSYQNSMNGKGGVHHCLLPEEKDLLIYTKDSKVVEEVRSELQTIDEILKINKYFK